VCFKKSITGDEHAYEHCFGIRGWKVLALSSAYYRGERFISVNFWMRSDTLVEKRSIRTHENSQYLPGFTYSRTFCATSDMQSAVENSDIIFVAFQRLFP